MNFTDDQLATLNKLLAVLLLRSGGMVSISAEELDRVSDMGLLYDDEEDAAGFTRLHLIPDYVSVEEEPVGALKGTATDEDMAKWLEEFKKKTVPSGATNGPWDYGYQSSTNISNPKVLSDGTTIKFEMKMTPEGTILSDTV